MSYESQDEAPRKTALQRAQEEQIFEKARSAYQRKERAHRAKLIEDGEPFYQQYVNNFRDRFGTKSTIAAGAAGGALIGQALTILPLVGPISGALVGGSTIALYVGGKSVYNRIFPGKTEKVIDIERVDSDDDLESRV
jgi:hypothetical protein